MPEEIPEKTLQDFYAQMEIMVQDNEGAIALFLEKTQGETSAGSQDKVFKSCLGRALETYSVDKSLRNGQPHTVTESGSSVFERDFYAVCKLASGELCGDLSRYFTHSGDGNLLNTAIANYRDTGDRFASRETKLKKEYAEHVSKSETGVNASRYATPKRAGACREEITSRLAPDTGTKVRIVFPFDRRNW